MKPSPISVAMLVVPLFLAPALLAQSPDSANQSAASPAASAAEVPRLIKFSGTLLDAQDRPMAGPVGVTFALHAQQTGGAALWMETQNVTPDAHGVYTVLLGANSANGVPAELFASGEARWLEVQVERQAEQPRILLVSVPYALKAKDAETLGGKPASAFLTTETLATAGSLAGAATAAPTSSSSTASPTSPAQTTPKKAASAAQPALACNSVTSDGTAAVNSIAKFTTACGIEGSTISENNGQVGIGGAPSTTAKLFLTDRQTNFGTRWLQQNIFSTLATANGSNTVYTLDLDTTNMSISPGVTDSGARVALRSLAYANNPGFAGTLNQQVGTLAQAGIRSATSGARVNSAYGGLFSILNQVPGTTINNAYGVWIQNSDAVGTITHRYDLYASSPNANNYFAGNVGIGTTTPVDKLDVAGNVNVVGNLNLPATTTGGTTGVISLGGAPFAHNFATPGNPNAGNTFLGVGAGNFSLTGAANTAVGASALTHNTTGYGNAAFGAQALLNNTTGTANVAFGVDALTNNTTGDNDSAFGGSALQFNTTGPYNSAFGSQALQRNTTGPYNSAFGDAALLFNTTGSDNSAFGFVALSSNTYASANSAFGSRALQDNTYGARNSAFGYAALLSNTDAGGNSAFGYQALESNTAGFNSAFGDSALVNNTTGSENSAFGPAALFSLNSGGSNTALGFEAGFSLKTGSNNIYISNSGATSESNIIRIGQGQTATFIAGISGVNVSGAPVLVGPSGQLGVAVSSQRFKDNIADMADESDLLMKLRPVTFYYKPELDPTHTRQYGLVAEEVAQVSPELVVFDKDGVPQTVRYHFVNAMLLNEVQKQRQLVDEQRKANEDQQSTIARQQAEIQDLAARLARLEALVAPAP
jgi:trimeric autotransporter adhesin